MLVIIFVTFDAFLGHPGYLHITSCIERRKIVHVHSLNVRNKFDPFNSLKCRIWKGAQRSVCEEKMSDARYEVHEG